MVPNPYGLHDDGVRTRTLWALREGLIVGAILLFWFVVALALSVVMLVLSVPFALFRFGAPGLPIAGLIWTIVGPLASLNVLLYVLVRAGTVIVDHYRSGDGLTFEPGPRAADSDERAETTPEADRVDASGGVPDDPDDAGDSEDAAATDDAAGTDDGSVGPEDDASGPEDEPEA